MICEDIHKYFKSVGSWVDWNHTTDSFKAGDRTKEINKVAVSWKVNRLTLEKAVQWGADLFISHESIAVRAINESKEQDAYFALPSEKKLFERIDSVNLTVYRCHDFWDAYPGSGVRDAWADGLFGLNTSCSDSYPHRVLEIAPMNLRDLAESILCKIKPLGQNGLLLTGDPDRIITKIGLGTGAATEPLKMIELGAEAGILTDDYYLFVCMGEHMQDLSFPTIIVNHGVSEEWGIKNLAVFIEEKFSDLHVLYIPHECPYKIITQTGD